MFKNGFGQGLDGPEPLQQLREWPKLPDFYESLPQNGWVDCVVIGRVTHEIAVFNDVFASLVDGVPNLYKCASLSYCQANPA